MNNKYYKVMMDVAKSFSNLSYCNKRKVGCVIAKDGDIISTGYNGTITGIENNCEERVYKCGYCDKVYNLLNLEIVDTIPTIESGITTNGYSIQCSCGVKHDLSTTWLDSHVPITTNDFTLHAEQNALLNALKKQVDITDSVMFITLSPCKNCAKLIAQAGIKEVVYLEEYRDSSGIDFLKQLNIKVVKYNDKSN